MAHAREALDHGQAGRGGVDRSSTSGHRLPRARQAVRPGRTVPARRLGEALPQFPPTQGVATRAASGKVLRRSPRLPELWGGSADLAGSNNTTIEGQPPSSPAGRPRIRGDQYGRVLHFGIREHGWARS